MKRKKNHRHGIPLLVIATSEGRRDTAFRMFRQRNWWINNYKSNKQVDTTQAVEAITKYYSDDNNMHLFLRITELLLCFHY